MKHLLSRFVRAGPGTLHVVDPYLDLRPRFDDLVQLKGDIDLRKMDVNVLSVAADYSQWWSRFSAHDRIADGADVQLRQKLRSKLLELENGIVNAMNLPNNVEDEDLIYDFQTAQMPSLEPIGRTADRFSNIRFIRNRLESLLPTLFGANGAVRLSSPSLIRPAIVEACNMDVKQFPHISDGSHFLCFTGVDMPTMLSCFVKKSMGISNRWPATFFAVGERYSCEPDSDGDKFSQTAVLCILSLYRDAQEATSSKSASLSLIKSLAALLPTTSNARQVDPPNLRLYEQAAFSLDTARAPVARFSRIGDYVSRRIHLTYDPKTIPDSFVGMNFTNVNLSAVVDSLS